MRFSRRLDCLSPLRIFYALGQGQDSAEDNVKVELLWILVLVYQVQSPLC